MNLLQIDQLQILAFFLVFLRCVGFIVSWPIFNGSNVPVTIKVLLSLLLAFICFSSIDVGNYPEATQYQTIIGLGIKEFIIGIALGFLSHLIFYAAAVAGEAISMSMGLSASQIFNPALGTQQSSVSQLYYFLTAFTFLVIQGHHHLIKALYTSFEMIPLSVFMPRLGEMGVFFQLGGEILYIGLMLSAPIMIAILLVNFSLGIVGRAVPQINVLITSLPINALLGFVMLIFSLPFFLDSVGSGFVEMSDVLFGFMRAF